MDRLAFDEELVVFNNVGLSSWLSFEKGRYTWYLALEMRFGWEVENAETSWPARFVEDWIV